MERGYALIIAMSIERQKVTIDRHVDRAIGIVGRAIGRAISRSIGRSG